MNRSHSPGSSAVVMGLVALVFASVLVGCQPAGDVRLGVDLIPSTDPIHAASTFEVRFDRPMIGADAVGAAAEMPIEVRPRVRGDFRWTSERGGVFTPSEPLELGTVYRFTLRPGLRDATGRPAGARLRRTVATPGFGLVGGSWGGRSGECSARPEVPLLFNAPVSATAAEPFLTFRSGNGGRVAGSARQGTLAQRRWSGVGDMRQRMTWEEWFWAARQDDGSTAEAIGTNPAPNLLLVIPREPLPPGTNWTLVIGPGLRMEGGGSAMREGRTVAVGDVRPFVLAEATAHNVIHRGRSIRLQFNKALSRELTNRFGEWVGVSPPVSNLTVELWGGQMALRGAFPLETPHEVTVRAGLPSADGSTLAATDIRTVTVGPIEPRLYLPAVETGQFGSGRRTFPLLAMNVDRVRVRAKRLDEGSALHGLRGFGRAYGRDREWGADFKAVDYELIPGRTVYDATFAGAQTVDEAIEIALDWDAILGPGTNAPVFLLAERAGGRDFMLFREDSGVSTEGGARAGDPTGAPTLPSLVRQFAMRPPARLGVEAMVQVSDLGLVWKSGSGEMLAFVFSLASGQPILGAQVQLLTDENRLLAETRTDGEGLARLPCSTNAVWLVAQTRNDYFAVEHVRERVPLWNFPVPWSYDGDDDGTKGSRTQMVRLFTDRDLYRPGETIHLKGVVRDWLGDELRLPEQDRGTLTLRDYRHSLALTTNVMLGAYGTFDLSIPIPSEARQGRYDFWVRFGETSVGHSVQVVDFRPRAFEIGIEARAEYAAGEEVKVPVSARYLFGKPLTRAHVRWTAHWEDQPPESKQFGDFSFTRSWRERLLGRAAAGGLLTGEAHIEGTNTPVFACDPGVNALTPQVRHTTLAVEVTDQNQQTLTQYAEFRRYSSDFHLGVKVETGVPEAGAPIRVRAVAIAPNGTPWEKEVEATLRLWRVDWQTARVLGAGNVAGYRSDAVATNVLERAVQIEPARPQAFGEWEASLLPEFVAEMAGEYLVELRATDEGGRSVVCSADFVVSAPRGRLAWDYRNDVAIELVPDQAAYTPGQTARLLVKTPIAGTALVTVERNAVRRAFVTRIEGNAPVVEVPILPGDAPNVVVFVTLLRGGVESTARAKEPEYRMGARNLMVEDPRKGLRVTLNPEAEEYLPGAEVGIEATVRDNRGEPVRDAEVILYAVDEGVLSMSDYRVPDLYADFFASRPIRVATGLSLPMLLPEDAERFEFSNKGYTGGGGGRERVRKNFAACAFWHGTLRTDTDGVVRVTFPAPDAITRYRILAVALTPESRCGSAESSFAVSKPLLVEPALPPISRRTDRLVARAVVHNQTASGGEVEVTLTLDETASADTPMRRLTVGAHGSAAVEFPVELVETGLARWVWRARFTGADASPYTDSVRSTMEVLPSASRLTERLAGTVSGTTNLLERANPQLFHGHGEVVVTLANSRLIGLAEAVPQLLQYPYGCAEQTASTLLPWLVLRESPALAPLMGHGTEVTEAAIRRGVGRLIAMRIGDGLSYWPGGREAMPWATAYGTLVLALARQSGVEVPEDVLKELTGSLVGWLPSALQNDAQLATGCLALYALAVAGVSQPAWHEAMFQRRARLGIEARALLALAVGLAAGPVETMETLLRDRPAVDAVPLAFGSKGREEAMRLLAWLQCRPEGPEAGALADGLVARLAESAVGSTQDGAWTLLALATYARECEGEDALNAIEGLLTWVDKPTPYRLDATNRLARFAFRRTADEVAPRLGLSVPENARVFARVEIGAFPPGNRQEPQDRGLSVTRTYTALGDTNQPVALEGLRVGDRVLVTLRLAVPEATEFVAVDDPLPAVLEAILPDFRVVPWMGLGAEVDVGGFSDFRELRADRALFFANRVPAGVYGVRYLARVRAAGTVTAPACKVEAMYAPERFGLSASQVLTTRRGE